MRQPQRGREAEERCVLATCSASWRKGATSRTHFYIYDLIPIPEDSRRTKEYCRPTVASHLRPQDMAARRRQGTFSRHGQWFSSIIYCIFYSIFCFMFYFIFYPMFYYISYYIFYFKLYSLLTYFISNTILYSVPYSFQNLFSFQILFYVLILFAITYSFLYFILNSFSRSIVSIFYT